MTILWLVGLGWMYVVVMMSVAEATAPNGSVLGALATFLLYGVGPLALALYLLGTPGRRRRLRAAEQAEQAEQQQSRTAAPVAPAPGASIDPPDAGRHPSGDPVAPERKEP